MNLLNASTGCTNFQIQLGRSPRMITPMVPAPPSMEPQSIERDTIRAIKMVEELQTDVAEAKDNLLQAKVFQTHYTNLNRSSEIPYMIGKKVMLSTLHRRQQYKEEGEK